MENPHLRRDEGAANNAGNVGNGIIADSGLCPYSPECCSLVSELSAPETADCRFCGQTFSRSDLIRYLAGTL